ncbi:hypothetical protein F441_19900 [Phytophthora nicotianae CJ01A1]|uniref:Helicase C-terminal domain-containing protein n=5 Tax=Phytophthora nicotianae TaxID=4792 RepID=W2Y869_PHYNI|nr:hypothetical protein L915_19479 [Phytophthora nicotianae]ETP03103.1 hypothetical protein F441_19900 [Phytophthora nicotianae CJ01A1]ETP31275.1 hypothetical protein F442_19842 [Phytophthora nicotianae P10297]
MESCRPQPSTKCRGCQRQFHLLLVNPCGHLSCSGCTEKRYQEAGAASCCLCHAPYSREGFKHLQPGIHAEPLEENDQTLKKKKKMKNKKRKRSDSFSKKPARPVNCKRDFWRIKSSKIFYVAARIRELIRECEHLPRERQHEFKAIVFSQSIWRAKVALEKQDIRTADFIPRINLRDRIKNLEAFRSQPDVHVLLLSNQGSHGLDLSFVTHMFLLEEIWDKSLEQQVISRANPMGAKETLTVEL